MWFWRKKLPQFNCRGQHCTTIQKCSFPSANPLMEKYGENDPPSLPAHPTKDRLLVRIKRMKRLCYTGQALIPNDDSLGLNERIRILWCMSQRAIHHDNFYFFIFCGWWWWFLLLPSVFLTGFLVIFCLNPPFLLKLGSWAVQSQQHV